MTKRTELRLTHRRNARGPRRWRWVIMKHSIPENSRRVACPHWPEVVFVDGFISLRDRSGRPSRTTKPGERPSFRLRDSAAPEAAQLAAEFIARACGETAPLLDGGPPDARARRFTHIGDVEENTKHAPLVNDLRRAM